jgi:prepilin peptidase CpaA
MGVALTAWAGAVAWRDAQERRIPNAMLLGLLVPAVVVLVVSGQGLAGSTWLSSLMGAALPAAVLLPGYALRAVGAGDVKLGAVTGFVLGTSRSAEMLLLAAVVLGLASALVLIRSGRHAAGKRLAAGPAIAVAFVAELAGGPWLLST